MSTEFEDSVHSYERSRITQSGYDQTVDDKIYTWKGNWADKPTPEELNVGNIIFVEDFPPYLGSVWQRVFAPLIFPLCCRLNLGLNTVQFTTEDSTDEQEVFSFGLPANALFGGANVDLKIFGGKSGNTIGGTFTIYAQAWDNELGDWSIDTPTQITTFVVDTTQVRIDEEFILKIVEGEGFAVLPIRTGLATTVAVESAVGIPWPTVATDLIRFYVTYESDSVGETVTINHSSAAYSIS